jgi:hypothetical protein
VKIQSKFQNWFAALELVSQYSTIVEYLEFSFYIWKSNPNFRIGVSKFAALEWMSQCSRINEDLDSWNLIESHNCWIWRMKSNVFTWGNPIFYVLTKSDRKLLDVFTWRKLISDVLTKSDRKPQLLWWNMNLCVSFIYTGYVVTLSRSRTCHD